MEIKITKDTRLCISIAEKPGNLGSAVFNAAFQALSLNYIYKPFKVIPKDLPGAVDAIRVLNIRGCGVSMPHKTPVMALLDEVDGKARQIGAVNTVINQKGRLLGFNTDAKAALDPLVPYGIKDKTVCIIGAGGAARAVAHGISTQGGQLIITNRSREKGRALADKYRGRFIPLDQMNTIQADIMINTTSLGMHPYQDTYAFDSLELTSDMVVMDVVYTPLNTQLLKAARKKGCRVIDGLSMFLHQGAAQFKLWTGICPDIQPVQNALIKGVT